MYNWLLYLNSAYRGITESQCLSHGCCWSQTNDVCAAQCELPCIMYIAKVLFFFSVLSLSLSLSLSISGELPDFRFIMHAFMNSYLFRVHFHGAIIPVHHFLLHVEAVDLASVVVCNQSYIKQLYNQCIVLGSNNNNAFCI